MGRKFEARTSGLAQELCEQLRLILEATVASKLQGDYRTGKRISMRKVISVVAWHGLWTALTKRSIERAVIGEILPSRSRFLF